MNKNEIINILQDWNFWEKDLECGILRESYLTRLNDLSKLRQVIVITGPRRSGKSYIIKQFARSLVQSGVHKNQILIINFEDPRLPRLNAKNLDEIYNIYLEFLRPQGITYIFLDEIQEVEEWEKWVNILHELKKAHIIISGSNAKLLSQELATVITGRHVDINVSPLSFEEFLNFHDINTGNKANLLNQQTNIKGLFRKYLIEGAYPEAVLSDGSKDLLLKYFDDILHKDLIRRYKIRKSEEFKNLVLFFMAQTASLISYNSTARSLGLTPNTVEKFSGYLENAYLLSFLKRFSFKVKEQNKSPRKIYSVDTGLANAVGFRFSENWGRCAENIVFLELKRRQAGNPNMELFFWKDIQHREVDFVLKENLTIKQMIQVAWQINSDQTKDREIRSLLKAMDELKITEALIITENEEHLEKIKGKVINFAPLWKWLLSV